MSDLIPRLLAAIDEREAKARTATPGPWRWGNWDTEYGTVEQERRTLECAPSRGAFPAVVERDTESARVLPDLEDPLEYTYDGERWDENAAHIVANDPTAVLRMCQAHRKLVEHAQATIGEWMTEQLHVSYAQCAINDLDLLLRFLAEGYNLTTKEGE